MRGFGKTCRAEFDGIRGPKARLFVLRYSFWVKSEGELMNDLMKKYSWSLELEGIGGECFGREEDWEMSVVCADLGSWSELIRGDTQNPL